MRFFPFEVTWEPWTESMRKEIEDRLKIIALDSYGLSEVIGPGVSCECLEQNGLHINEDHFLPEIIDPETGKSSRWGLKVRWPSHHLQKKLFLSSGTEPRMYPF